MMLGSAFLKVMTIITRIVIAAEALAPPVGMHVLSESTNPCTSFKNNLFLGLGGIVGLELIPAVVTNRDGYTSSVFYALALVSIVAPGYGEYLGQTGFSQRKGG